MVVLLLALEKQTETEKGLRFDYLEHLWQLDVHLADMITLVVILEARQLLATTRHLGTQAEHVLLPDFAFHRISQAVAKSLVDEMVMQA